MRLFAALPLPSFAVERLSGLRLRLASPGDGLRWSNQEQWHITVRFLGDLDAELADRLIASLRQLRAVPVDVVMDELGLFANKGILFARVQHDDSLVAINRAVEDLVATAGLPAEVWPFRPHITLCRSKGKAGHASLQRLARPALPPIGPPLRWRAEELCLYESYLDREGAVYEEVTRIPLRATDR